MVSELVVPDIHNTTHSPLSPHYLSLPLKLDFQSRLCRGRSDTQDPDPKNKTVNRGVNKEQGVEGVPCKTKSFSSVTLLFIEGATAPTPTFPVSD